MKLLGTLLLVMAMVSSTQSQQRATAPAQLTSEDLWHLAKEGDKVAVEQLRTLVGKGDAVAGTYLGLMYYEGEGMPKDLLQSAILFRKAADQGHDAAQFYMGVMNYNGEGMPKDFTQAASWYRKAAELGASLAQFNLGRMYVVGEGVPRDIATAYMWINLAAAQGDEKIKAARDSLEKLMTPAQIAEGQKLSREWKPKK